MVANSLKSMDIHVLNTSSYDSSKIEKSGFRLNRERVYGALTDNCFHSSFYKCTKRHVYQMLIWVYQNSKTIAQTWWTELVSRRKKEIATKQHTLLDRENVVHWFLILSAQNVNWKIVGFILWRKPRVSNQLWRAFQVKYISFSHFYPPLKVEI